MGFGHEINNNSNLQFSAPNFEMVKLFKLIGLGSNGIKYFTIMIISLAFIMLYLALINSVEQRKYDIAIFRSLGSSKQNIFSLIMIESFLIVFIGSFFGLILGQLLIEIISEFYFQSQEFGIKGFIFIPKLYLLWILFILTSQIIAILPAIKAYKIQIKNILTYA